MSKFIVTYPLDLKGTLVGNFTEHSLVLGTGSTNRSFAYPTGPFYAKSFRLVESSTPNVELVRGKDYQLILLHPNLTKLCKSEIACAVVVFNPKVSTDVIAKAQIVGGPYAANLDAIEQAINSLDLDNRILDFTDLRNVPSEYATAPAYSDIGDVYGFEYIVTILAQMIEVLKVGDSVATKQLEQIIESMRAELADMFQQHIDSEGNVHSVTREQMSVYSTAQVDGEIQKVITQFNQLASRLGSLESEDVALNLKLDAINDALNTYTQQLTIIRQNYQRTNSNVAALSDQVSQYETQIATLQQTILTLTNRLADTQKDLSDTNTVVTQHTAQLSAVMTEIAAIKEALVSGSDGLENHINKVDAHPQYLDKNKGGVIKASLHVEGEFTSTGDIIGDLIDGENTPVDAD